MKQIFQDLRSGDVFSSDVPVPKVLDQHVLIKSNVSLISPGTERMLVDFGRSNYFKKAKSQPEKIQQVLEKLKTDGVIPTLKSVDNKLKKPIPLGYSNCGVVLAVGSGVESLSVGDRIVSNGAHAEVVQVPEHLSSKIPANVADDTACFTVLGAVALQGIRLVKPQIGEHIVVFGLGVIGLLTVQILVANGCNVIGIDFVRDRLEMGEKFGAQTINLEKVPDPLTETLRITKGAGVDAAVISTSTSSDKPIRQAAQMCRRRGRIILVGVTGLKLSRTEFYEKELTFQVSCSYGPGRYDKSYEELGVDYPIGFVRWTEQRNFDAVLNLMSKNKIVTTDLISHRFDFFDFKNAYDLLHGPANSLGIILKYRDPVDLKNAVEFNSIEKPLLRRGEDLVVGLIGGGSHSNLHLMPAFKRYGARLHTVISQTGVSGSQTAKKFEFCLSSTDESTVFLNKDINSVVIASRHNLHADMVVKSLSARKNTFVEKPIGINLEEITNIRQAYEACQNESLDADLRPILMVGFNRRFSPLVQKIKDLLDGSKGPINFLMTVNAGKISESHWAANKKVSGGPIVSEVCHFLDLLRFLSRSRITAYDRFMINGSCDDGVVIHLTFASGSIGTINYIVNGHKSVPKERLEVFVDGKMLHLNNFRDLTGFGWKGFKKLKLWSQDKGHRDCVRAFVDSVRSGKPSPIPFEEIIEVSETAVFLSE